MIRHKCPSIPNKPNIGTVIGTAIKKSCYMPICRELNSMKNPDQTDRNERITVNNHRLKLVSHISRAG